MLSDEDREALIRAWPGGQRVVESAVETILARHFAEAERERDDLRSRLACIAEATSWDRPYDTRLAAIRGMCDLTTNGMTPIPDEGGDRG